MHAICTLAYIILVRFFLRFFAIMAFTPMGGLRSKSQAIVHHWDSSFVSWIKNNYLSTHLNFRWKMIGGSKVQKLVQNDQSVNSNKSRQEQQYSSIVYGQNICPSVYHHKPVIIFNSWNIWTFGTKKFRKKFSFCKILGNKDAIHNTRDSKVSEVQGKKSLITSAIRSNIRCYSYNQSNTSTLVIDLLLAETDTILGKKNSFIYSNHDNNLDANYSIHTFFGTINNMGKGTKKPAPAKSSNRTVKKIPDDSQANSVEYHEDDALDDESDHTDDVMAVEVSTIQQISSSWIDYSTNNDYPRTIYQISVSIFKLASTSIEYTPIDQVLVMFNGLNIDPRLLQDKLTQSLEVSRTVHASIWALPEYFGKVEQWVRQATDDKTDETAEAYKVLGYFYALSMGVIRNKWLAAAMADFSTIIGIGRELGLSAEEDRALIGQIGLMKDNFFDNHLSKVQQQSDVIMQYLDGIAESEAQQSVTGNNEEISTLYQYIDAHNKAGTWSTVIKGPSNPGKTMTLAPPVEDAYCPLPVMAKGTAVATSTLVEETTPRDLDKGIRMMRKQRGREFLYPAVNPTEWPTDLTQLKMDKKNELLDKLTVIDTSLIYTRILQIFGMKKPVLTAEELESGVSVKTRLQHDIVNVLEQAGSFKLNLQWFNDNWSRLFRETKASQETVYVVLSKREYFGTVGTYGTTQLDAAGLSVPFGMKGNHQYIHARCQTLRSSQEYNEQSRDKVQYRQDPIRYYKQYWLIAMPSDSDPEIAFNDKSGPIICIFRGIHSEAESATELAVELYVIQHWLTHTGISQADACLIMDQVWHTGRQYPSGEYMVLQPSDPEYYPRKYGGSKGYTVVKTTENIIVVRLGSGTYGNNGRLHVNYNSYVEKCKSYYAAHGSYVNSMGIRLEMFPTFEVMRQHGRHHFAAGQPHKSYVVDIREHILAREFVEEMLSDPTRSHNNWNIIPNATQVFYQPRSTTIQGHQVSARMTFVWRDVPEPKQLKTTIPVSAEAQSTYLAMTNHMLEINAVASKYSSSHFGGASCTNIEVDTRTRYVRLGNLYADLTQAVVSTTQAPFSSPPRKKMNTKTTPEKRVVEYNTPSTSSQVSSVTNSGSTSNSVVRYDPEYAQFSQIMARMSSDMEGMRTQLANMSTSVSNIETRQSELDSRVDNLTAKVQTSSQLKSVLRSIKQTANGVASSRQKIMILNDRLASSEDASVRLQLDLERTTESELYNNLLDFRSDAQEIALVDDIVLTEEQLRSDV